MLSHRCNECEVNWAPYQAMNSCPACGRGVVRRQAPIGVDVHLLYAMLDIEAVFRLKQDKFDAYMVERDAKA
jgi:hypothetical protein